MDIRVIIVIILFFGTYILGIETGILLEMRRRNEKRYWGILMKKILFILIICIIQEVMFHFLIRWEIKLNPELFKDIILTDEEKRELLKKRQ